MEKYDLNIFSLKAQRPFRAGVCPRTGPDGMPEIDTACRASTQIAH